MNTQKQTVSTQVKEKSIKSVDGVILISKKPMIQLPEATERLYKMLASMNSHNRRPSSSMIAKIANDMRYGYWEPTGQGISISTEGEIIDGQHRIYGFLEAGCPKGIFIPIMTGCSPKAQGVCDQGLKRSHNSSLGLEFGLDGDEKIAPIMNVIAKFETQLPEGVTKSPGITYTQSKLMREMYGEAARTLVNAVSLKGKLPAPVLGALTFTLFCKPERKFEIMKFMEDVEQGTDLGPGDYALVLRDFISKYRKVSGGSNIQNLRYKKTIDMVTLRLSGIRPSENARSRKHQKVVEASV